jgi:LuxR family maltose regulon positive regulatory protein
MTRITSEQLAFTTGECRELLATRGVQVTESTAAALTAATEGWAAALVRAADLMAAESSAAGVPTTAVSGRDVTGPLLQEIFADQPPALQHFLLATGIAERLWPGLATALTARADAADVLAALERANLFIRATEDGRRSWAYTPMFRAFLRERLYRRPQSEVARLHLRAAAWLSDAGFLTEAACHLASAGSWRSACTLLMEDFAVLELLLSPGERLGRVLAHLPDDVPGPEAALVRTALALGGGNVRRAAVHLERAVHAGEELPWPVAAPALGTTRVLQAVVARAVGDVGAGLRAVHDLEELLPARQGGEDRPSLRAVLLATRGDLLLRHGDLAGAAATLDDAVGAAGRAGCERLRTEALGTLALTEAVLGRLGRAADLAVAADVLAGGGVAPARPAASEVALAWVCTEQYDLDGARVHLRAASADAVGGQDPVTAGILALVRARLARAAGDLEAALDVVRSTLGSADQELPQWLERRLQTAATSLHVAAGRAAALPRPRTSPDWRTAECLDEQVSGWLETCARDLARGQVGEARASAERALRLAEVERLRRPVAEAPAAVREFVAEDAGLTARRHWLGPVVLASSAESDPTEPVVVERLTDKEQEVLEYLSDLLSTEEIAQAMFVSVNTVKSHVRSILRKLSATRRNEAVRRARQLDLLSR